MVYICWSDLGKIKCVLNMVPKELFLKMTWYFDSVKNCLKLKLESWTYQPPPPLSPKWEILTRKAANLKNPLMRYSKQAVIDGRQQPCWK